MKPTLYADDLDGYFGEAIEAIVRILPVRCPAHVETSGDYGAGFEIACEDCDGRGFGFPDMPDWWGVLVDGFGAEGKWHRHCEDTWRVMFPAWFKEDE